MSEAPRNAPFKKIGEPGTRSDGTPCPFQLVVGSKVLCGYEARGGAEADLALYKRNPAMKAWALEVRRTATPLLDGAEPGAEQLPSAPTPARRAGGRR